jgi:hypothetical protein
MLFLLVGCRGARYYTKRAEKLQAAGMTTEAADLYFDALVKNPAYVDARIGLRQTGQKVLDSHLERFFKAMATEQDREAVYAFREARRYYQDVKPFVELDFPDYRRRDYEEVKARYLKDRYREAHTLLDSNRFEPARQILDEILSIDSAYRDASALRNFSEAEPAYRAGLEAYRRDDFRRAYELLSRVRKLSPGYKETARYWEKARDEAALSLALLPFSGPRPHKPVTEMLSAQIMEGLTRADDPLLRVIDRQNTDRLLQEQKLALSGLVDESTAAGAGQLIGAKAVLTGKLIQYRSVLNRPQRSTEKGWKAKKVAAQHPSGERYYKTTYVKTQYQEVEQTREVALSFQYQLISSETGEVLATKVIDRTETDQVRYAEYDGEAEDLYPGFWVSSRYRSDKDKVYNSASSKRSLDQKLNARRSLREENQMRRQLIESTAAEVLSGIHKYIHF